MKKLWSIMLVILILAMSAALPVFAEAGGTPRDDTTIADSLSVWEVPDDVPSSAEIVDLFLKGVQQDFKITREEQAELYRFLAYNIPSLQDTDRGIVWEWFLTETLHIELVAYLGVRMNCLPILTNTAEDREWFGAALTLGEFENHLDDWNQLYFLEGGMYYIEDGVLYLLDIQSRTYSVIDEDVSRLYDKDNELFYEKESGKEYPITCFISWNGEVLEHTKK